VIDPGALLRGVFIATALPSGRSLAGVLSRDDRHFSGFTDSGGKDRGLDDRSFVGLSPKIHYRRVIRR
jgi:hypothetical protein